LVAKIKTVLLFLLALSTCAQAISLEFELLTDPNNMRWLPQQTGWIGVSGDHLIETGDDIWGSTYNPDGCFSFNFMNDRNSNV